MPTPSFHVLRRVVEALARACPPRHRDLVRGMLAELDSIRDPWDRTRFALGAIVAAARLAWSGSVRGSAIPSMLGGPPMPTITSGRLLGRLAIPFAVSLVLLTALLLANVAVSRVEGLGEAGEILLLSLPHTLALTIPMSVLFTVSWVFMRLGKEGALGSARRGRRGVRRLMVPVLGAAAVVGGSTLILNTQVVPRANARLAEVLRGAPIEANDRTMTVGQLRQAAEAARIGGGADAEARAAMYEVEVQKKFALAMACVILALVGAAVSFRFPRGGGWLMVASTATIVLGYYGALVTGEWLADEQIMSPVVAMWGANALLLALASWLLRDPNRPGDATDGVEVLAVEG
jgi:lipopolysaccharide export LptBFGC system permease protein LptF